jgi:hypothetical protein
MFGTFILDAYRSDERRAVADALEGIASARDRYGFASGGIYCFWELETRDVLYIGRAIDLPQRFRQHNGFAGKPKGSKREYIQQHFTDHEMLGFSVLVRSPNEQTSSGRFRKQLRRDFGTVKDLLEDPEVRSQTELEIAYAEGLAIQSLVLATGALPPWNRIFGTLDDWAATMDRPDHTREFFTGRINTLLQARSTIRELDADPTATQFESVLLGARTHAAGLAIAANAQICDYDILRVADRMSGWPVTTLAGDIQRIREAAYVLRKPWIMDADEPPGDHACREAWTAARAMPAPPAAPRLR